MIQYRNNFFITILNKNVDKIRQNRKNSENNSVVKNVKNINIL